MLVTVPDVAELFVWNHRNHVLRPGGVSIFEPLTFSIGWVLPMVLHG